MSEKTTLADILDANGVLTKEQVSQVKLEQINTGRDQGYIIRERGFASPKEIVRAQAQLRNVPFIDLSSRGISPSVLSKIPEAVARNYNLIPVGEAGGHLQVAMEDPLDLQVLEFLETKTGQKIDAMMAVPVDIKVAIEKSYSPGIEKEDRAALKETEAQGKQVQQQVRSMEDAQQVIRAVSAGARLRCWRGRSRSRSRSPRMRPGPGARGRMPSPAKSRIAAWTTRTRCPSAPIATTASWSGRPCARSSPATSGCTTAAMRTSRTIPSCARGPLSWPAHSTDG